MCSYNFFPFIPYERQPPNLVLNPRTKYSYVYMTSPDVRWIDTLTINPFICYSYSARIWVYGISTNRTDEQFQTDREKDFIPADALGAAIQEGVKKNALISSFFYALYQYTWIIIKRVFQYRCSVSQSSKITSCAKHASMSILIKFYDIV